jgi:hypothetical protein
MGAGAEEIGFEQRDHFVVSDHTENVKGGEIHAFKADLVVSIDGVLEDAKKGCDDRVVKPHDTFR